MPPSGYTISVYLQGANTNVDNNFFAATNPSCTCSAVHYGDILNSITEKEAALYKTVSGVIPSSCYNRLNTKKKKPVKKYRDNSKKYHKEFLSSLGGFPNPQLSCY